MGKASASEIANTTPAAYAQTAQRFETQAIQAPQAHAFLNAAQAWMLAEQPARAKAAARSALRYAPASSAARSQLAQANTALHLPVSFLAPFDEVTTHWLGVGGRQGLLVAGVLGLLGAGVGVALVRSRLKDHALIRTLGPWGIAGGLALTITGTALALHTAFTLPQANEAVVVADTSPTFTGPGPHFASADMAVMQGDIFHIQDRRNGYVRLVAIAADTKHVTAAWFAAESVVEVAR
ncbi:MAG: hypothetical protein V3V20_01565 [Algisphaera sp.]